MKITIIFLAILIIFGVAMSYSYLGSSSEDYEKLADAITAKTAKKLKNEKSLVLVGTGGRMMDDIKMMMMGFEYRKIVSIEIARKLLVDSVEEYLSEINTSEKIRPFLHNYTFTAKNIEIVIYFRNPDGSKVSPDQMNIASAKEGQMFYYADYPEKHTLKVIREETYEEALRAISSKD
jgi:hypothetical protein